MKKYKITNQKIQYSCGKTLYRIQSTKQFGNVPAGTYGGFVESEKNLSQKGNCWIYGNAMVYDNAQVIENAGVFANARVFGKAIVAGDSIVERDARIFDNVRVSGSSHIGGRTIVYDKAKIHNYIILGNSCVCGLVNLDSATVNPRPLISCGKVDQSFIATQPIASVEISEEEILRNECRDKFKNLIIYISKLHALASIRGIVATEAWLGPDEWKIWSEEDQWQNKELQRPEFIHKNIDYIVTWNNPTSETFSKLYIRRRVDPGVSVGVSFEEGSSPNGNIFVDLEIESFEMEFERGGRNIELEFDIEPE